MTTRSDDAAGWARRHRARLAPLAFGLVYGLAARILMGADDLHEFFAVMATSFIYGVPFALGFVVVWIAPQEQRRSWTYAVSGPWGAACLTLLAAFVIGYEGLICVVLILPAFLIMSSIGGLLARALLELLSIRRGFHAFTLASVLLLPYLMSPVERRMVAPESYRTVENRVRIRASADEVWPHIARVPPIQPHEYGTSFVHRIGFPRPIEATLSHEGVGGVRRATFERGVLFLETVTVWEPGRTLSFTIHADSTTIARAALDEHVTVGGEHFDVLDGTYEIEPAGPRDVVLRLRSTHRLSTHFNLYSSWWTDLVMSQIQSNILQVVKHRSETRALTH
ncbi:MAG TPA: hypothetical protein VGB92_18615 [Longimicrobium sp.]|jgi:hypothetical protein